MESVRQGASEKSTSSPLLIVVLLIVAGWLASESLFGEGDAVASVAAMEAPKLFVAAYDCDDDQRPDYRAMILVEAASAKAERYPFAPADGVSAVQFYAEAEACYRKASRVDAAEQTALEQRAMRERVERDFATYRLSLLRAIEQKTGARALAAVTPMLELCAHLPSSRYVAELRTLKRRLAAEAAGDVK